MAHEIAEWLERLGLGKYSMLFIDNEVDLDAARDLTDDDLKDLGLPLGPRKKLLRAIKKIPEQFDRSNDTASEDSIEGFQSVPIQGDAERRHLTVMFCDLVDSTELATKLDPEDMHSLLVIFQETCGRIATDHGGHVAKLLGDGILIYFGYPIAQEDDAERAVRAALGIVAAVKQIKSSEQGPLRSRVGIASGVVVIGDILSGGGADAAAVSGSVPHLAARLESSASPNSVLIAQSTRRLIGQLFELEKFEGVRLKGFDQPVSVYSVRGEADIESRFAATRGLTERILIGRDNELGILRDSWSAACESEGQAALVSGEAGIGKSTLVAEFTSSVVHGEHVLLRYQCSPQHTDAPFYPIITQMRRAAGFASGDSPEEQAEKLHTALCQAGLSQGTNAPIFAALIGIKATARYGDLAYAPEHFRALVFDAFVEHVHSLASAQPVLIVVEDLHWADPLTKELLARLVAGIRFIPVMLLGTTRPGESPSWLELTQSVNLTLNRMRRRDAANIAKHTAAKNLEASALEEILEKADGNPLFLEELTRSFIENNELGDGNAAPAIPATLHDSLISRLDRLSSEKDIAQKASVVGRTFQSSLIASAFNRTIEDVRGSLTRLVDAGIVLRNLNDPTETFEFKHALIRDAAYDSLTKSSRAAHHLSIAECLEESFPQVAETDPGLLAGHFIASGSSERALKYLHAAGLIAHSRTAISNAAIQLRQGIEILAKLPETQERDRQELDFQAALGATLILLDGYGAETTLDAFKRSYDLLKLSEDNKFRDRVLHGLTTTYLNRADLKNAKLIAAEREAIAQQLGDEQLLCSAIRSFAGIYQKLGDFRETKRRDILAFDYWKGTSRQSVDFQLPQQVAVGVHAHLAISMLHDGQCRRSKDLTLEAIRLARTIEHPNTLCYALWWAGFCAYLAQDYEAVASNAEELNNLATSYDFPHWLGMYYCLSACSFATDGDVDGALNRLEQGRTDLSSIAVTFMESLWSTMTADLQIAAGRYSDAANEAAIGIGFADKYGTRWFDAELIRLRTDAQSSMEQTDESVDASIGYRSAVSIAREQGSKLFELRSLVSLANTIDEPEPRSEVVQHIDFLLSEFDADESQWDTQRAKACLKDHGL